MIELVLELLECDFKIVYEGTAILLRKDSVVRICWSIFFV